MVSEFTEYEQRLIGLYFEHRPPFEVARRYIPGKKVPCEGHYVYSVDGSEDISEKAYKVIRNHMIQEGW